ncbi:Golgi reassembly-stacking protein 2 [Hondaea fermentalgiana]|uniref:Golgi reassembly-stacking protein 2 n=1 Tax=Hondaea fermentalgiana TaxID=2315210 RepID=A0A2R5GLA0_9STRA|nr:Golgi reassembly-stacking protein 2 [Hondaea fermentalgiana]|eukprot:GBG31650.1 Golgi reassembly-stacking protein 2 [Hondaea fermentalgiana]
MGSEQSTTNQDGAAEAAAKSEDLPDFLRERPSGYRVLAIQENSPACREGIVPFFDFIVKANEVPLQIEDGTFVQIIRAFENKPLTITIFNCKCKQLRKLSFVPRRGWGGDGLLGLTIKFDTFADADEKVVHVLDVVPKSPANLAGLQPHTDYLLGTPYMAFSDLDELFDLVSEVAAENDAAEPRGIDIFVYSTATDTVRRLVITPRSGWGGDGILGCGIGFGYLHRLPRAVQDTTGVARVEDLIALSARTPPRSMHTEETKDNDAEPSVPSQSVKELPSSTPSATKPEQPSANSALQSHSPVKHGVTTSIIIVHPTQDPGADPEIASGQWVMTQSGPGVVLGRRASTYVISLDWKLANGASCFAFLQRTSFHAIANPARLKSASSSTASRRKLNASFDSSSNGGNQHDQELVYSDSDQDQDAEVIDVNLGRPQPSL